MREKKPIKKWMKLDNAAKIYPAARSVGWMSVFRLSAILTEKIDPEILKEAERRTALRFPSMCQKLKKGLFWYYLEEITESPVPEKDVKNPCASFDFRERNGYMFRVRYHENRIALEVFHVLTDGTGGLVFLKTLIAEYLELKYGVKIPRDDSILDVNEKPKKEEIEDSHVRYARGKTLKRDMEKAYRQKGEREEKGYTNVVTAIMDTENLRNTAKKYGATVTEYLTAALVLSFHEIQTREKKAKEKVLPVRICVPVNLRKFYNSKTMRNFAQFVNVGVDYSLGEASFEEILKQVKCEMGLLASERMLNAKFSANVRDEKNKFMRLVPLFIKNPVMKTIFKLNGDRTSSTTLSNLGLVTLPDEMSKYITRFDFMLGALSRNPSAFASISYNGVTTVNMVRSIKNSEAEKNFCRFLVKDGVHVKVESNSL